MSENSVPVPVAGDRAVLLRRYVGSLYALALQDNVVDDVCAELRGLRRLWNESPEWRFVASDPRIANESACQAAAQVVKLSGVGTLTGNFLSVVAANRRLDLLPALIEAFLAEVSTQRGEHHADIRIARPLSAAQHEALSAALAAVTGGKVHMNVIEDASLIGGLTVKLGSQLVDASVKTRLDHLERALKTGTH